MKKSLFLLFSIICTLSLIVGCTKPNTAEEALKKVNLEADEIYSIENYDYIEVLFYKDKGTQHLTAGIFNVEDNGNRSFIKFVDFHNMLSVNNEKISVGATFGNKSLNEPEFTFQYGIINDPQIEKVKLYMIGDLEHEDRYATVINFEGLRVWYTFLDTTGFFNVQEGISNNGDVIYSSNEAFTNTNSIKTNDNNVVIEDKAEESSPNTDIDKIEYLTGEIITDGLYKIYEPRGYSTFCFIPDKESLEIMKDNYQEKNYYNLAYDNLDDVKNLPKELGIYKVKLKIEKVDDYGYLFIDKIELTDNIGTVIYEGKTFETNDIDNTVEVKDRVGGLIVDHLIKTDDGGIVVGFAGEIECEGYYLIDPRDNEVFECKTGHIYFDKEYNEKLPTIYGEGNTFYGWFSDANESFVELQNHSLFGRGKFKTTGYYLIYNYGIGPGPGTVITEIISLDENYKNVFTYEENTYMELECSTVDFAIVAVTKYGDNYEHISTDYYYINKNKPEKIFLFSSDRYDYTVSELKNEYEFTLISSGLNMTTGITEEAHSIICKITGQGAIIEKIDKVSEIN